MALRQEEIDRIRYELGVPLTRVGAEPYITWVPIFAKVIQPYLFDNSTTSTTAVSAAPGGAPISVTLVANPEGPDGFGLVFAVGTSCVVDVGPAQEIATIAALSGLVATMTLANAHGGAGASYPIAPNGAEQIVRDIFVRLDAINVQLRTIAPQTAGITQADEIKLSPSMRGRSRQSDTFDSLVAQRDQARQDLADAIGFKDLRKLAQSSVSRVELY